MHASGWRSIYENTAVPGFSVTPDNFALPPYAILVSMGTAGVVVYGACAMRFTLLIVRALYDETDLERLLGRDGS
jgi:hypothetical protein